MNLTPESPDASPDPLRRLLAESSRRNTPMLLVLAALASAQLSRDASAQAASLVHDIHANVTIGSSEPKTVGSERGMIRCGQLWYFTAKTLREGRELWCTDGSAAGTRLVKDLIPGQGWSEISTGVCGKDAQNRDVFFFFVSDGNVRGKWYRTDGTAAGTTTGTDAPRPTGRGAVALGDRVLFMGTAANNLGEELHSADGSEATATLVKDIRPGSGSSNPTWLTLSPDGKSVLFQADDGTNGLELWTSDGTSNGTVLLKDINPGAAASSPGELAVFGGKTYFQAFTADVGFELWETDGTAQGTVLLKDIDPGVASSRPRLSPTLSATTVFRGELYFSATTTAHGVELFKTDGTTQGTVLAADIAPGTASSVPIEMRATSSALVVVTNDGAMYAYKNPGLDLLRAPDGATFKYLQTVGDQIFFFGNDATNGIEPYVSNGTVAGTFLLRDILPGSSSSQSGVFRLWPTDIGGGRCLFSANEGLAAPARGYELWVSDGTGAGTTLLVDIDPSAVTPGANPAELQSAWGSLLFTSANDGTRGIEPHVWSRSSGMRLLGDLAPGSTSSSPTNAVACGDRIYFVATTPSSGRELVESDGTSAGTKVHDIDPGTGSSNPRGLTVFQNKLYFVASTATYGSGEYFVADPATGSVALLADIVPGPGGIASTTLQVCGTKLFFVYNAPNTGSELWVTDGTTAGTVLVKDISPGTGSSNPLLLTCCGDKLYFTAAEPATGVELWESDGTSAGTKLVSDIRVGSASSSPSSLYCHEDAAGSDRLFFAANDGVSGVELWMHDGATTTLVMDIRPGSLSSSPQQFASLGGLVCFVASSEAWVTDGSSTGTFALAPGNIVNFTIGLSAYSFLPAGGRLIFAARPATTPGLSRAWSTDGTVAGTMQLHAEALIGSFSGLGPQRKSVSLGDHVVFEAMTPATGSEAWITDGTVAGTRLLADVNAGPDSSTPVGFLLVDGRVLFTATTPEYGAEIWQVDCPSAVVEPLGLGCDGVSLSCTALRLGKNATLTGRRVPDATTHVGITFVSAPRERPFTDAVRFEPSCWSYLDPTAFFYLATHTTSPGWTDSRLFVPNDNALRCLGVVVQSWYLNVTSGVPVKLSNAVRLTVGD